LFFPEFEFIEITKHKQDILEKSGLSNEEFRDLFSNLLRYVKIIKTEKTINFKEQANNIIGNIDKDDAVFIATALAFDCPIWSDDRHFQKQDKIKIFTTKDMVGLND
jgi:predicted nucleic acid-binding protein